MLTKLGAAFLNGFQNFLYASGFFFSILKETFRLKGRNKVGFNVLVMQILFTGVNALSIISFLAVSLGVVIIIQGMVFLPQLGQSDLIYVILITIITKELGPILTAFIVMARSGVAIATEIGNMVASQEIEAYLSVGINPISYLVVPRFIGVIVSMFLLNIYFNVMGLAGSFFFAQLLQPIPANEYFLKLLGELKVVDVLATVVKSLTFGVVIATVSTYNGFRVNASTTEIPVIVIRAVGQGFVLLIITNVLISALALIF